MGMFGITNMANAHVKWGKVVMICGEVVFVLFCRVWRDFGDDEQCQRLSSTHLFHDDPYILVRQAYTSTITDTESEPFKDSIEIEDPQSLPITSAPIPSPDYTPATPHTDEESKPMEASETRVALPHFNTPPSDSTSPLSLDLPLPTQTSLIPTPSRAYYYRSTARMAMRMQPTLSPGLSARVIEVMTLSLPSFLDTKTKGDESEAEGTDSESEESEDVGPSSESKEAASEDQQQQTAPVEDTVADESLGLGYGATRLRQTVDKTPTPRLLVRTTWEDPVDGTVYTDIKCDMPPIQTPASPECSFGSLPISPASLIVPSPVATPASVEPVDEVFLAELGAEIELHGGILHDHTQLLEALPPSFFEGYEQGHEHATITFGALWQPFLAFEAWVGWTDAQRAALWQTRYKDQREIHAWRMQHTADQREMQEMRDRVAALERRMDCIEE
ncbi:hypothetical protein Tco_0951366 [Tanacetum coccineum]|uniref:Uncharacterized protein n=1 Tax=Tanacetum coccineum TaxID=301880 RepID=A0ABQ5DTX3_9ASTR